MKNFAFEPYYDNSSRVLILGSFPSVKSRETGFYYGNKQNRFWKTLAKVFNEDVPESIKEKQALLDKYHIALYDIVQQSSLKGSSDLELSKNYKLISNLNNLLQPYTKVEKIICNGKLSYNLTINNFKLGIPIIYLPSTSPANPNFKFETWQKEFEFLKD